MSTIDRDRVVRVGRVREVVVILILVGSVAKSFSLSTRSRRYRHLHRKPTFT